MNNHNQEPIFLQEVHVKNSELQHNRNIRKILIPDKAIAT
jgi:hypothetical protein